MIIPIRCITCGRVVAQHWENYKKRTESGEDSKKVLDELGIESYCCRALFITHTDSHADVSKFVR